MTTSRLAAVWITAAACGHPAATPARPGEPAAAPPAASLERIERIARACLADHDGRPLDWASIGFAHGGAEWRVRVDEAPAGPGNPMYVDVMVDPVASTCDGRPIDSAIEPGDAGIDAVTTIAQRCHTGPIEAAKTTVSYHRLATGAIDHGRFDVMFYAPGVAVTFPLPHYLVDFPAGTCKKVDERF